VKFSGAKDEDMFFGNPNLLFSQVLIKAEIVKRVYGIDATEMLGNKQNYGKEINGYREYKYDWLPLEAMLLHSGYMGLHTITAEKIKEIQKKIDLNTTIQIDRKKKSIVDDIYVGNKILEKREEDTKYATIAFNEELKELDDIPVGNPLTNKCQCSFAVLSLFSRMTVRKQYYDKNAVLSLISHTQPDVNHRATEDFRMTGGKDSDGQYKPGMLCTAYGKEGTEEYTFGKNDATIIPYSNKLLRNLKVHEEKGKRAFRLSRATNLNVDYDTVCRVQTSVVLAKSHPSYPTRPAMGYLGRKEYEDINNLCVALFEHEIWCYFDLENDLFKQLSWNDRVFCLVGGLLNMIQQEFRGFSEETEIWRYVNIVNIICHVYNNDVGLSYIDGASRCLCVLMLYCN